jgi:hypothetical protein
MENQFLNPWTSNKIDKHYFNETHLVYINGYYKIFRQHPNCYLYTYKNVAINQLAGLNKAHLDSLANHRRPENGFLFDRAIKNKEKAIELLNM